MKDYSRPISALPKLIALALIAFAAGFSHAVPPEIELAAAPLSGSANIHPNVLLSLSLDHSSPRAAYLRGNETYDRAREYIGYFNPRKCYAYQGGNRNVVSGYFYIVRDADTLHECNGSFSGNFMNWAAASMLDLFRYALTGGDRISDTLQSTVLQRAVLNDGMYADPRYFPRKLLKAGENSSAPSRVTPFNVDVLFIVSCRNRILFSDVQGASGTCDASAYDAGGKLAKTDKRLGEYLARVQVCDRHEGGQRSDLCRPYGKYYKPVGVIQHYADTMRFAAMGYLLDASERRYGGVLRSPMAYTGEHGISHPALQREANPTSEWDPDTGILYSSPGVKASGDTRLGGVINYINRFGRSGAYKQFDPISELYYEGVRYLQGKPATDAALENLREGMKDGFPVLASALDPVTAACQQHYLISFGDANTHWDRYVPGNQRTALNDARPAHDAARPVEAGSAGKTPVLDARIWTEKVGDMEADAFGRYANPAPRRNLANLHLLDTGAEGQGSYYMAGLAYWANTQDIRLDKPIRARTFVIDFDDGGDGSLDGGKRTVKPRDSQLFLAAKYGGFQDANQDGNPFVTIAPDGKALSRFSTEEWAVENTDMPEAYVLAGDPVQLVAGIRRAFAMVANQGTDRFADGTRHNVLVASADPRLADKALYQTGFNRARWSGSLQKFSVESDRNGVAKRAALPLWEAGALLTGTERTPPSPAPDERKIYTSSVGPGGLIHTVEFSWRTLDAAQRAALSTVLGQSENDVLGRQRVEYLRGARTLEAGRPNGVFRARRSVLGDIVNSAPVYTGSPSVASPDADYPAFHARYAQRARAIYVGANDGMLHAFDAESGAELFAYIPNRLLPSLELLTHPDYVHRPYVDGGIAVSEAKLAGGWRTVLAAGMGAGAQGVFALDVSDPARFSEGSGALWEFTDSDDPDIGNIMAAPQIAKLRTSSGGSAAGYEYFVVVPSGLNYYKPDGTGKYGTRSQAALFLLSLQKAPHVPWKLGVNYYKIKLPAGEESMPNGLSSPALTGSTDGAVRHAYAGDLQGNLWRFDFKEGPPWSKALGASPKPLFTARDEGGQRQPITTQPKLVYAARNAYMVLFGTGKFVEAPDTARGHFAAQSFYGILDNPDVRKVVDGRKTLSERTLTAGLQEGEYVPGRSAQDGVAQALDPMGWFIDFPDSKRTGERLVYNPVVAQGRLFFSTLIPSSSPCERDGGRLYAMDTVTGLPREGEPMAYTLAPGAVGSPLVTRDVLEIAGPPGGGRRKVKERYSLLDPNGGDPMAVKPPPLFGRGEVVLPAGRLSWREITNWQELRDEALRD